MKKLLIAIIMIASSCVAIAQTKDYSVGKKWQLMGDFGVSVEPQNRNEKSGNLIVAGMYNFTDHIGVGLATGGYFRVGTPFVTGMPVLAVADYRFFKNRRWNPFVEFQGGILLGTHVQESMASSVDGTAHYGLINLRVGEIYNLSPCCAIRLSVGYFGYYQAHGNGYNNNQKHQIGFNASFVYTLGKTKKHLSK